MHKIFIGISALFLLLAALAKLFDFWLRDSEKGKLKVKIEELWLRFDDMESRSIAQAPLKLLDIMHNAVFGNHIFSKKAYFRASIISIIVLISLLFLSGLYTGAPFSMKFPPWQLWEKISDIGMKQLGDTKLDGVEYTEEEINQINKRYSFYGGKAWIIGHSTVFIILSLIINAFFDATSLIATRMMLREAISVSSNILLFCIFSTNIIIAVLLANLSVVLVMLLYYPHAWFVFPTAASFFPDYPALTTIGTFSLIVVAWKLGGVWLKIIAFTTTLPILILCISLILYFLLYPFRASIHDIIRKLLLKIIDHEKGLFGFFGSLGAIGVVISIIIQILE